MTVTEMGKYLARLSGVMQTGWEENVGGDLERGHEVEGRVVNQTGRLSCASHQRTSHDYRNQAFKDRLPDTKHDRQLV